MASTMDNLRERWERITPRERTLILALGVAAVVAVVGLAGRMVVGGLDRIEAHNEALRQSLLEMQAYRARTAQHDAAEPEVAIPDRSEKLGTYLEEVATQVEIEIPSYKPQAPAKRGEFEEQSMKIEVRGLTIQQLADFLQRIESKPGVVVSRLMIKRNFREKEKLIVELTVSSYSRAPKADKAEDEPAEGEAGEEG